MKIKKIEVELSKDDIVTVLADALQTRYFTVSVPDFYLHKGIGGTLEQQIMNVLFSSGVIYITDLNSSEPVAEWKPKNSAQCPYLKTDSEDDDYGHVIYKVNLRMFYKAVETEEGYLLMKELLSGNGDIFTAYNILQLVLFGKLIYS